MKEYPINFNTKMVRAILDGSKTQTRRIIKPQPICKHSGLQNWFRYKGKDYAGEHEFIDSCPYGQIGDKLWVKETFYYVEKELEYVDVGIGVVPVAELSPEITIYRADEPDLELKWNPSIHMPKDLARIFPEITSIRAERVQDISCGDCCKEGIHPKDGEEFAKLKAGLDGDDEIKERFADFWDSNNAKRGYGWDENPWVWVIEFKKEEKNE